MLNAKCYPLSAKKGQAIAEILIGFAVVIIIVGSAIVALELMLKSNSGSQNTQSSSLLGQEYVDAVKVVAEGDWHAVYDLTTKGATSTYYVTASGTQYVIRSGTATTTSGTVTYTRYFSVENVSRSDGENIDATYTPGSCPPEPCYDDPSTQKITVYVQWTLGGKIQTASNVMYLTRWRNKAFNQSDWNAGSGQDGPLSTPDNAFSTSSNINVSSSTGSIILQGF